MKTAKVAIAALVGAVVLCAAAAAQRPPVAAAPYSAIGVAVAAAAGPVGVDVFYRNLSPYGYWVQRPSYGWVWTPRQMRLGWRPYSAGRWVYSDYGWTWVAAASEPWGWATYHYGRWYDDPDYGWQWVPGTDWGPAWVSWQSGGGYLGWAPLPPAVGWSAGVGLDLGGFNLSVGLAPASYCFVPTASFLAVNVGSFIVPAGRNVAIFHQTTNITNYGFAGNHVFNRAFPVETIERATGQRVPTFRVADGGSPRAAALRGDSLALYRPAVERRANTPDPAHVAPRSVIAESRLAGIRRSQGFAPHAAAANAVAARHAAVAAPRQAAAAAGARTAAAHRRANHAQAVARNARQRSPQVQHHNPPAAAQRRTVNRQHPQPQRQDQTRRQPPQQHRAAVASSERRQHQAPVQHGSRQPAAASQARHQPSPPPQRQPQAETRRQSAPPQQHQQQAPARRPQPPPQQHQAAAGQEHREKPPQG
jgi:hypothetical protein